MPVTAKAWEAGDLGLDHATVIQQATGGLNDAALAAELEGFLAQQAGPLTPRQLRVVAEEVLAAAPDESADQAARKTPPPPVRKQQVGVGG
jgi:hypothetical protein